MAKTKLQVSELERHAERRDKPWGETRVDSGASSQGCWSYKWLTGALRARFTCRAVEDKSSSGTSTSQHHKSTMSFYSYDGKSYSQYVNYQVLCGTHTQEFCFFFLVHFMLNILFGLFAESVQTVLQSPACLLTSHPMSPLLVSQNWCTVCCHTGARRPQLWAWLCSLKPETPRARANVPLLLYFSLLSTLTFRELIYTLYRGPTGHCTEWHRQTFQSGPLANGTTGILSSLGHPLKVTF